MFWSKKAVEKPADTSKIIKEGDVEYLSITCPTCDQPHKIAQVVRVEPDEYKAYADISERVSRKARRHSQRWIWLLFVFCNAVWINSLLKHYGVPTDMTWVELFIALNILAMVQVFETFYILMHHDKKYQKMRATLREKYESSFLPEVRDGKFKGIYLPVEPQTA